VKAKSNGLYNAQYAGFAWLLGFACLVMSLQAFGQAENPYSRYGLGTLHTDISSANEGLGYLAAPYASALNVNAVNPASYGSLTRTTFQIGALIDGTGVITKDSVYRSSGGSVDHVIIAFVPNLKQNAAALVMGLVPYSTVNYNFLQAYNDSAIGPYNQSFLGSGQLYHVFMGGAFKIKGFSIGANLGYIFGKLQYQKIIGFPDTIYGYNTNNETDMNAKSFSYTVGVQYQKIIYHNRDDPDARRDIYGFFGAYVNGGSNMAVKISQYTTRFNYNSTANLVVVDTLQSTFGQKGTITMPYTVGAGAMFGNERFWLLGADFKFSNTSSYTTPLDNGGLDNSWQVSFGGQITPKYDDRGYLKRIQYRIGGYFGKTEYTLNSSQVSTAGATLGLGFPLWKQIGHLNFAGDFGTFGTGNKTEIHDNYYRFTVGIVLNDIWFVRRKFD
jgi:hypothetical protein